MRQLWRDESARELEPPILPFAIVKACPLHLTPALEPVERELPESIRPGAQVSHRIRQRPLGEVERLEAMPLIQQVDQLLPRLLGGGTLEQAPEVTEARAS